MVNEALRIGVVMQRLALQSRWQSYQWRPLEIVGAGMLPDSDALEGGHCLLDGPGDMRRLFTGFDIKLFRDEAEGYFLNINAPNPCWFIMWRIEALPDGEIAVPKTVTLSYNEAARLMDGGEQVDTLPLSSEVLGWIAAFTQEHYRPEPKRKRKKPSFEGGEGVDRMARAEENRDGR
jgi:hypothetical protein